MSPLDEMESDLQQKLTFSPKDTSLWFQYASWKETLKEFDIALGAYKKVCHLESNNQIALEEIAEIRAIKEQREANKKSTIKMHRTLRERLFDIDLLIASQDRSSFHAALKILSKAIESDSKNANLWFRVGICKQGLSDYKNALVAYEKAVRISPKDARAEKAAEELRHFDVTTTSMWRPTIPSVDIDYWPYLDGLSKRIGQQWHSRVQDKGGCRIVFKINRAGQVSDLTVSRHSESAEFDEAARASIQKATPLSPLPEGAPGSIDMTVSFNEPGRKDMGFSTDFAISLDNKEKAHASH